MLELKLQVNNALCLLGIPSITRIIALHLVAPAHDLESQRFKVRDSIYFTCVQMVGFPKFSHIRTYVCYNIIIAITSIPRPTLIIAGANVVP